MKDVVYWTGIGSRQTPTYVLKIMTSISCLLSAIWRRQFILRSGGADGADLAFEIGNLEGEMEIFLPWRGFNKNQSPHYNIPEEAFLIAEKHHPAWPKLSEPVRRLMARNVQQVLGKDLDHLSAFVLCWTPDGCTNQRTRTSKTGGTGLAISIADEYGVPVYNLKNYQNNIEELISLLLTKYVYVNEGKEDEPPRSDLPAPRRETPSVRAVPTRRQSRSGFELPSY